MQDHTSMSYIRHRSYAFIQSDLCFSHTSSFIVSVSKGKIDMISELEQINMFKVLSFDQLEKISAFCKIQQYYEGDILIEEGDEASANMFILLSGSVEIVSSTSMTTSNEVVLSREDKEIFGEIGWLCNTRRTAGVRCNTEVEAIYIDGIKLMAYLEGEPTVGFQVMRQIATLLAKRMEESNRLLKQLLWNRNI